MSEHEQRPIEINVEWQEIAAGPIDPLVVATRLTGAQLGMWRSRFTDTPEADQQIGAAYELPDNTKLAIESSDLGSATIEQSFGETTTRYVFDRSKEIPLRAEQQIGNAEPTPINTAPDQLIGDALRLLFDANRLEQQGRM